MTDNRLPLPTYRPTGRHVHADATPPVMTTGQIAKACGVAPRTVTKWIDGGLLNGYRIPGGQDRRATVADVIVFMRRSGVPVPPALVAIAPPVAPVVCWGLDEADPLPPGAVSVADPFALGELVSTSSVRAALVGDAEGLRSATAAATCIRRTHPAARLVLLADPDVSPPAGDLWSAVLTRPVPLSAVLAALEAV